LGVQRNAQRNWLDRSSAIPVELDSAYELWGKAVHALVTANDRFVQISPRHPEKFVAWAEVRAAQSELDAAANEIDSNLPAQD
jgi:hypothetical protein